MAAYRPAPMRARDRAVHSAAQPAAGQGADATLVRGPRP